MRFESASNAVTRTRHFFANGVSSAKKYRLGTGQLLGLVLLPLLVACLPVPVGDPAKSRVDPGLSGAWRVNSDDAEADDGQLLVVLDPYDEHTWLATLIGLDAAGIPPGQSAAPQVPFSAANADGFRVGNIGVYKCWLTRIGGETFITWESKTLSETLPSMAPKQWWVFRVRKDGDDSFYMDGFDYSIDGLDKVTTSKQAEKIIRRHVRDPGFFKVDDSPRIERLPDSDVAALPRLLEGFGLKDTM